ncbi:MAG: DUF2085 domain-containing protein [Anaerolineae bacterium]|nr:DUF2085 domain-containing protein [Anaerolineae bacterium]
MPPDTPSSRRFAPLIVPILAVILLVIWLEFTPPGLLGKADAIAYAVCHRIPSRSFFIEDRPVPLCARCTGMYLGAFVGLIYQFRKGRGGRLPQGKFLAVFGVFFLAFAIDGSNSYLHFFPNAPHLYESTNLLRLVTGTGLGLGMAVVLVPTFNQTIWQDWGNTSLIGNWREMLQLILTAATLGILAWSQNFYFLYPLALVSSATVWMLLGMIYTIVWVLLFKRENTFTNIKQLWLPATAGLTLALMQIAIIDLARYAWSSTWGGFQLP